MSRLQKSLVLSVAALLFISNVLFGLPIDLLINTWNNSKIVDQMYLSMKDHRVVDQKRASLPQLTGRASAANFTMQTGYYVGNGSTQAISGLGFQPQFVIIKPDTTASQGVFKTNVMAASNTAFFSATTNNTGTLVTLDADGFTVANNAATNTANVRYTWTAFTGSDCTASGTICVGTYTGNGGGTRLITTGFQPAYVMVKQSTAVEGNFRTSSMPSNYGAFFGTTTPNTSGALFTTLPSNGFNVGSTNNTSSGVYYYVAFKAVVGVMAVGSYSGTGADNRSITGFGASATPDLVMVKNAATSGTASNRYTVMNNTNAYGDYSSYISVANANAANLIQALQADGFQVGTAAQVNTSGTTYYWAAWGGAANPPPGSGSFDMAVGSYTGNGASQSVTGLAFSPDLVIVKGSSTTQSVFRTSMMAANNTAYLANAATNFTGGITALNSDGFTLGSSTTVNSSGTVYHWQAFGNAYNPVDRTGATDFAVGSYMGSGTDNRTISDTPFQPDMVTTKRNGSSAGVWRTSAQAGDSSEFFAATAEAANRIQNLNSAGFQVGTQTDVNAAAGLYHWFAFKNGDNFTVNSYTGTGATQTISSAGFQPDLVWVKNTAAQVGVHRGSSVAGNSTQNFGATANFTNGVTGLVCNGFSLTGTTATTNANASTYRYAAWRVPSSVLSFDIVDADGCPVASPSVSMPTSNFSFDCSNTVGTLGVSGQKLRIKNMTGNPAWSLSIAATNGAAELWRNSGNTEQFDYNDSSGAPAGCSDGGDSDSKPGRLSFDPSSGTITPQSGCSSSNLSLGSSAGFTEGSIDAITLITASSGADMGCYWDLTGLGVGQYIPGGQPGDTYTIDLTLTITAL